MGVKVDGNPYRSLEPFDQIIGFKGREKPGHVLYTDRVGPQVLELFGLLDEVVVDPGKSYFDTNTAEHHHFYHEDIGRLEDIPGDSVVLGRLPEPPAGTRIGSVDVVIRVTGDR